MVNQTPTARLPIQAHMLRWARERAGLTPEALARRLHVAQATVGAWEQGKALPTWQQTWALARALRVPIGYLFLERAPQTVLPTIADFRAVKGAERAAFSPDLEDTINDALRKQDWLREWRAAEGFAPLPFIGRYRPTDDPERVAQDICAVLDLPQPTADGLENWEKHLRRLVEHAEAAGVLVLQSGVALGNPHRPLKTEEFRGFALADAYAPVIFINARDSVAGRIFTLAHELAHLWIGQTGVSNPQPMPAHTNGRRHVEAFCNQVAAETLMPRAHVIERWRALGPTPDARARVEALARHFLVSTAAALVRARTLALLAEETFSEMWHALQRQEQDHAHAQRESSGGNYFANLRARNGRPLVDAVAQALKGGQILVTEAAQLLNASPALIGKWLLSERA